MNRALGWRADTYDSRDRLGSKGIFAKHKLPLANDKASLLHVRGPRIYQVGQSCVGFSIKRCMFMSHRLQGVTEPQMISGLWPYTVARRQENKFVRPLPPLQDVGCYPTLAMQGLHAMGFVSSRDFPETQANVNQQPKPVHTRRAYDQKGDQLVWYKIGGVGTERVENVRECLRNGWPVMFGMLVDGRYLDHRGSEPVTEIKPEDIRGGHMQAVMEVRADGNVQIDNWWPDWGFEDGFGLIGGALFGSPWISDVITFRSTPTY